MVIHCPQCGAQQIAPDPRLAPLATVISLAGLPILDVRADARLMFLRLWDEARDSPGYEKARWMELQILLGFVDDY